MKLSVKEIAVFGMLGGLMYASKALMEVLPWDFVHGVSNFCCGVLICPLIALLQNAERLTRPR